MSPVRIKTVGCVLGLTLICFLQRVQSDQMCRPSGCLGDDCLVSCSYGTCGPDGQCECQHCFNGVSCDLYVNKHAPTFDVRSFEVDIPPTHAQEQSIKNIAQHVTDLDLSVTCLGDGGCPCAAIRFHILTGNWNHLFSINEYTGDIYAQDLTAYVGDTLNVEVEVRNEQEDGMLDKRDRMTLSVQVEDEEKWQDEDAHVGYNNPYSETVPESSLLPHKRQKRAAVIPLSPIFPDNVTFHLFKTGIYEHVTEMRVGDKLNFLMVVHFPVGSVDMLVELFTPDGTDTFMIICDPKITRVGTNLDIDPSTVPTLESLDGSTNYDRAIYQFNSVTNSGGNTGDALQSMIEIEWDTLMIDNPNVVNGSTMWVSAGAEYNNQDEVWVGQASFTTIVEPLDCTPAVTLAGPAGDTVEVGASSAFTMDMFIACPSTTLTVDVFAPLDDAGDLSVCGIAVTGTGKGFKCLNYDNLDAVLTKSASGKGNFYGTLPIGTVTNAGVREPGRVQDDDRISVEFTIYVNNDPALITNKYWVGAAVQVGGSQIWAGQIEVTVVAATATNMVSIPTFDVSMLSNTTLGIGATGKLAVDFKPPKGTVGTYALEVLTPLVGDAPAAKICRVSVLSQGVNVPCVTDQAPVYSSRSNGTIMDRAVHDLGRVRNSGHRSTAVDPTADSIVFEIIFQLVENAGVSPGDEAWITIGMTFDGDRLWVAQHAYKVDSTPPDTSTVAAANFDMKYDFGTDSVAVTGATRALLTIQLLPGETYGPMEVELIMPENSTAILSICRAQIMSVGANLPCLDQKESNASVVYESKAMDGKNDKARVGLGMVCNTAPSGTALSDDDTVVVAIDLRVEDVEQNEEGAKQWVSAGVGYSDTKLWVGQIAIFSRRSPTEGYVNLAAVAPHLETFARNHTSDDIPQGGVLIYELLLKVPPQSSSKYVIRVESGSADLSVCRIFVVEAGSALACVEPTEFVSNGTDKQADGSRDKKQELDMGFITNLESYAFMANNTFDNSSLRVHVVFQLSSAASANTGSTHNADIYVDYDNPVQTLSSSVTLTSLGEVNINTPAGGEPVVEFYRAPLEGNQTEATPYKMTKGEVGLYRLDIIPTENSMDKLTVKFLTPANSPGELEICEVNVVFVGDNIPCLKRELISGTYTKRTDSDYQDIAAVDLGVVCQAPVNTTEESKRVTVEAVVSLPKDSSLVNGDKVWLSAVVKINDDMMSVTQLSIEVDDNFVEIIYPSVEFTDAALAIDTTLPSLDFGPAEVFPLDVVVTVPANVTIRAMVDMETPVNKSAVMTLRKIELIRAGRNLGCMMTLADVKFVPSYTSSMSTTQMDKGNLDLGVITNTGVSYRTNDYQDGDDSLTIRYVLQMADAHINLDTSTHWLSVGAKVGQSIFVLDQIVTVVRNNDEQPELSLTATVDLTPTYQAVDQITVEALLKHVPNVSKAEAYNVSTTFYIPPTLKYVSFTGTNHTSGDPQITEAPGGYGVSFLFEQIYFTDIINFIFVLAVNATTKAPLGGNIMGESPYDITCQMIWRQNHKNTSGTYFITRLDDLSFLIEASGQTVIHLKDSMVKSHDFLLQDTWNCVIGPLGMEDGRIQDCQITNDPWYMETAFAPMYARKGSSSSFKTHPRGGRYKKYLQVDFGNVTKVTAITFDSPASGLSAVTNAIIWYSDDGLVWLEGDTLGSITLGSDTALSMQEASRLIRVEVDGPAHSALGVNVEFKGCVKVGDKALSDICQKKLWEVTPPPELYYRGFVSTTTALYFCDTNPEKANSPTECFSTDDGVTFSALDNTVTTVLGYSDETSQLYGISWDQRSFISSEDKGATWFSISRDKYDEAKVLPGWQPAKEVPWMKDADLSPGATPSATYSRGNYGAGYDGMYINPGSWKKVTDWTTCCV